MVSPSVGWTGLAEMAIPRVLRLKLWRPVLGTPPPPTVGSIRPDSSRLARFKQVLLTYAQFVGPGFVIAVGIQYVKSPISHIHGSC
jgi:hypothetical protein